MRFAIFSAALAAFLVACGGGSGNTNAPATETRAAELNVLATAQAVSPVASVEAQATSTSIPPTASPMSTNPPTIAATATVKPANTPKPTAAPPTATTVSVAHVGEKLSHSGYGTTFQLYAMQRTTDGSSSPDDGNEYVAFDVEVCAGTDIPSGKFEHTNPLYFFLVVGDNTRPDASFGGPTPRFEDAKLQANDCIRGWIAYEVPQGTGLKTFQYIEQTYDAKTNLVGRWDVSDQ